MTVRRRLALGALASFGAAAAFGGRSARAQAARTPLVVAPIASTDMAGLYYAQRQGAFERAGLDLTITPTPTGAAAMVAVTGGAAQIGYTNTLGATTARAKGVPIVLLAPGAQYNTNRPHAVLIVAADSPLRAPSDLEGRVVAVAGLHDLLGVSVVTWLQKNGIDPSKVKFAEMPPSTMLPALQAKRVDAAVSYEPFLSSATSSGSARVFAKPYDAIATSFLTGAWFALAPWTDQHREAAIRFAQILSTASQYVDDHYDDMIPLISSFSKLPPETLHAMVKVVVPGGLSPAAVQPVIDTAARQHEIPTAFRAQEMILAGVP